MVNVLFIHGINHKSWCWNNFINKIEKEHIRVEYYNFEYGYNI